MCLLINLLGVWEEQATYGMDHAARNMTSVLVLQMGVQDRHASKR